jgi:hypothetical protein
MPGRCGEGQQSDDSDFRLHSYLPRRGEDHRALKIEEPTLQSFTFGDMAAAQHAVWLRAPSKLSLRIEPVVAGIPPQLSTHGKGAVLVHRSGPRILKPARSIAQIGLHILVVAIINRTASSYVTLRLIGA